MTVGFTFVPMWTLALWTFCGSPVPKPWWSIQYRHKKIIMVYYRDFKAIFDKNAYGYIILADDDGSSRSSGYFSTWLNSIGNENVWAYFIQLIWFPEIGDRCSCWFSINRQQSFSMRIFWRTFPIPGMVKIFSPVAENPSFSYSLVTLHFIEFSPMCRMVLLFNDPIEL